LRDGRDYGSYPKMIKIWSAPTILFLSKSYVDQLVQGSKNIRYLSSLGSDSQALCITVTAEADSRQP